MQEITSINNNKVKEWIKLKDKKYRDFNNRFIVEGEHLVREALRLNLVVELITTEESYNLVSKSYLVPVTLMKAISSLQSIPKVVAVINKFTEKSYEGNILLVDSIQDPGNLGTIVRTCVAFGIKTLVLGENSVDVYNQKTINASEGMIFNINIIKRNLVTFIDELNKNNYKVYGTDVNNGIDINDINISSLIAVVIGNEGNGIKKEILNKCDENIYVKTNDECESLNVAVATGIILHRLK